MSCATIVSSILFRLSVKKRNKIWLFFYSIVAENCATEIPPPRSIEFQIFLSQLNSNHVISIFDRKIFLNRLKKKTNNKRTAGDASCTFR
jgi:hypothetical protein